MDKTVLEIPVIILTVLLGIGALCAILQTADHFHNVDLVTCYEVLKDKTAQDILLICKGR